MTPTHRIAKQTSILLAVFAASATAAAQPLTIEWSSIDAGGGVSTGGAYAVRAVIGQPDTQLGAAAAYEIRAGFLAAATDAGCYPDCDGSGALDFFDFLCFQNAFATGKPAADCDASGVLDFFDFLCFQNEFAGGCP
ncbi:MAG: GC-type dockerin domain-anchored protein [Phycisphaerales bacterium JB039]